METKILLPWFMAGLLLAFATFFVGRWLKRRFAPQGSKRENLRVGIISGVLILGYLPVIDLLTAGHLLTYDGVSGHFGSSIAQFLATFGCIFGPAMADNGRT